MRAVASGYWLCAAITLSLVTGHAQQSGPASADPRVGLAAGVRDAGTAARHMALIASLPKPEGFFDPNAPAGVPAPPEETREQEEEVRRIEREHERAGTPAPPRPGADNLNQGNSDLAFHQNQAFVGSFHGFNVYDIESAGKPRHLASVVCPGGQGDVSVYRNLLFMSVEQTRARLDCGTGGVAEHGECRPLSRRPHLRCQRRAAAETNSRRTDVPWIAYAHACRRSGRYAECLHLWIGHGSGPIGEGTGKLFSGRSRGGRQHSTLQHRCHPNTAGRSGQRPHRQPSAHFRRQSDRIASRASGRVVIMDPERSAPA